MKKSSKKAYLSSKWSYFRLCSSPKCAHIAFVHKEEMVKKRYQKNMQPLVDMVATACDSDCTCPVRGFSQ